jgi:hypothetical protein
MRSTRLAIILAPAAAVLCLAAAVLCLAAAVLCLAAAVLCLAAAVLCLAAAGAAPAWASEPPRGICINEVSALGIGHDWVEIYNASPETIECLPLVLRDTIDPSGNTFPFCVGNLRPGERRVVTCPNLLNGNGEELAIVDRDGNVLDAIAYGRQTFNLSWSRETDAGARWLFQYPTPREPNGSVPENSPAVLLAPPSHAPLTPAAGDEVGITVAAVAAAELELVEIIYRTERAGVESPWWQVPCRDDGSGGDEEAGDGQYFARLPGSPAGTVLRYRIRAVDVDGNESIAPSADDAFVLAFGYEPPPVRINEILASNRMAGRYKYGDEYYPADWIELYNMSDAAIDVSGWFLADRRSSATNFKLLGKGSMVIPAKGHLLIWAQRYFPEDSEEAIGVNFSLSRNGEEIVLFAGDTGGVVDTVVYPPLATDAAYGRVPEGTGEFEVLPSPTPQGGDVYPPKRVEIISYDPLLPQLGESVTVEARITPDVAVGKAEVYFWLMDEGRVTLFDDGTGGDKTAGDGVFTGRMGPFGDSGILHFALEVEDLQGAGYRDPERASKWFTIPFSWLPSESARISEVFAASHLCSCGCLAFQSLDGPLEPTNFVEIRNDGEGTIDLRDLYLTDDPLHPKKYPILPPEGGEKVEPGARYVVPFFAGDEKMEILHPEGGWLFLGNGMKILDAVQYGEAQEGRSYGFFPDLGGPWGPGEPSPGTANGGVLFIRGDANSNRRLNVADAVIALRVLFNGLPATCPDALDADDNGILEITDPLAVLGYLFAGGPVPAAPFPAFGEDPTSDALGCGS